MRALGLFLAAFVGCVHRAPAPDATSTPDDVLEVSAPRHWTPKDADQEAVVQAVFVRMLSGVNEPPRPMVCLAIQLNGMWGEDLTPRLRQQISAPLAWPKTLEDVGDCLPLVLSDEESYEGRPRAWIFSVDRMAFQGKGAVVRAARYGGMERSGEDEYTLDQRRGVWRVLAVRNIWR